MQPSPPFLPRGQPLFTQQPVYSVPAVPSPHLVSRVELPEFRSWLYHLPAVGPWASYSASVCIGLLIIKWVTNSTDTVEQLQWVDGLVEMQAQSMVSEMSQV